MEEKMTVRLAAGNDLPRVAALFAAAVAGLRAAGLDQWDEVYPDRAVLRQDIAARTMYISEIGAALAAAAVINRESDPGYRGGRWRGGEAGSVVLHRLCVSPAFQHRGLAEQMVRRLEENLRGAGVRSVRLDVFPPNGPAVRLYQRLGYRMAGTVALRKGRFYLMEKML